MVPERHRDFEGTLVVDKYAVYPKMFDGNEIRWCWAHELHYASLMRSCRTRPARWPIWPPRSTGSPPCQSTCSRQAAASGRTACTSPLSPRWRRDRQTREIRGPRRGRRGRARPQEPAPPVRDPRVRHRSDQQPSELPLRRPVAFRKSSQQCKGGRRLMERTDHMTTCSRARRDEGKYVFREVRRTVLKHGTRGGAGPASRAGVGRPRRAPARPRRLPRPAPPRGAPADRTGRA